MDINDVRKILHPVWQAVAVHGRCWGKKNKNNPMYGSHITFMDKDEVVTIFSERIITL